MDKLELSNKNLLVVDDEKDLREIIAGELEFLGARVFQAENIHQAFEIISKNKMDIVITDIRMPGGSGIELLDFIKSIDPFYPAVILITGFSDIGLEDALNKGAEALLNKPFKLDELVQLVARLSLPLDKRFYIASEYSNQNMIHSKKIAIPGRGGVMLELSSQDPRIEIGQNVNFDFIFQSHKILGTGICRWKKISERDDKKTYVGLEFLNLAESSLNYLTQWWRKEKLKPFIPSTSSL